MLGQAHVLARPGHALGVAALVVGGLPLLGAADHHDWEILPTPRAREGDSQQLLAESITHDHWGSSVDVHVGSVAHAIYVFKGYRQESLFLPAKSPAVCYMYAANPKQIGEMA
jgi:hypothetical protein